MFKNAYILTIAAALLYGCTPSEGRENATAVESHQPEKLEITTVTAAQPEFFISLPGELLPYEEVDIYAKARGFLKKVYADRGAYVTKGQLLAVLEAPELSQAHSGKMAAGQTAYQKYLFSRQAYERLQKASKNSGAVAALELERAYAQLLADSAAYRGSMAETAASKQMHDYLTIRAPFSGVITSRHASEGALIGESGAGPVFSLAQTDKLRLTVAIPEKEKSALHKGTKAVFTLIDFPGETFEARFSRSSETLDAALRSVVAEFDVENRDKRLSAGQYARVKLNLRRKSETFWVPPSSIVQSQQGTFVVKETDGKAKRVFITPGIERDTLTEVFGDLRAGDRILKKGSEEVTEGEKID